MEAMETKNWIRIEFPSESVNVSFARTAIALFASQLDFTIDELEDVKVAVSEGVSNSVIHGYDNEKSGRIILEASHDLQELTVSVEDFGKGIPDITMALEAGYTTVPAERMGLGLAFIHEYMHDVKLHSEVGVGTKLVMKKRPEHARV